MGCLACSAGALAQAPVVDTRELDERLKRIERLFGSDSLFKLFDEVESLGTEVRELRGQLETLSHTVNQLKERQRELYLDVDQRLQRIESAAPAQAAGSSQQPGAPIETPATQTETAAPSQSVPAPGMPSDRRISSRPSASTRSPSSRRIRVPSIC